ncbi:hypothetical protein [Inquilinus sp. CAU 1745]|uniref:hypothetical protein n=1 Tax=Inquilinus sp. CAU 1745 TaxID=3140369 RepID=UPI00325A6CC3
MNVDDALAFLCEKLKENPDKYRSYGYDVYLPQIYELAYASANGLNTHQYGREISSKGLEFSPVFYAAAWELCRRGILRPGISKAGRQITDDGQAGNGYSYTPVGRKWLNDTNPFQFIPIEPTKLGQLLGRFEARFGSGFHQRAQESIKCYHSTAYLAACVMAGAAAESILIALAISISGDEAEVLRKYKGSHGTQAVRRIVAPSAKPHVERQIDTFIGLISYWRNDAAHGTASVIAEFEAFEAVGRLLRFAHWADDQWDSLTS